MACGDGQCALVFRHLEPLSNDDLGRLGGFEAATGIAVLLQPAGPASIHPLSDDAPHLEFDLPDHGIRIRFEASDFIQVNTDREELGHNRPVDVGICGDAKVVLEQLTAEAKAQKFPNKKETPWIATLATKDKANAEKAQPLLT